MIEPDFFGCSGKLSFDETRRLALMAGSSGDFAEIDSDGVVISSIDRVHRCARDWKRFARIALNHVFGDVRCSGAMPVQAMLSFEFGADAEETDHALCSSAFLHELKVRGVALGKCHSGRNAGVTAVTVAVLASGPRKPVTSLTRGRLFLSRPIGALKLLYLSEMGISVGGAEAVDALEHPRDEQFHLAPWSLVTDVSGHGLLGALAHATLTHGLAAELTLCETHVASSAVLEVPVECLQNPLASYGRSLHDFHPNAIALATLRETAGPFLGFMEDGADDIDLAGVGIPLGRYSAGDERIDLTWIG